MGTTAQNGPLPFAPNFVVQITNKNLTNTDQLLIGFNALRVAVHFVAGAAGAVAWVCPARAAAVGTGYAIASQANEKFRFSEDGGIVQQEWHGLTNGAGLSLCIIEIIWHNTQDN